MREREAEKGEKRLTGTSHVGNWSHCAAHRVEVRGEYFDTLSTFLVHEGVNLCVCLQTNLLLRVQSRFCPYCWKEMQSKAEIPNELMCEHPLSMSVIRL